ncbi:SYN1-like protein [Purpureocillium lilacinum]|uniref:SYN1-like protein n=1 Tax=Purpureocillium lilacinum TaxID=33203 RepID=A0A179GE02_PURLI|nr:SYN1-like protein [Purpureocillium lilacinum]
MSVSVLPSPSPLHTVEDRTPTTSGITAMVPPRGSKAATAKAHLMEVAAAMARTRPWTMATLVSGNVEMAPLAQNASSMGGGDPNGILNECRDIDRGVDEVDRNLEQLRMLQQRTLDDADSSASSANNRQLDALSSETMALYRSLTERVRLIKSNPDSRTPKNNPQVSRVDRRLKAAIQQYQQIESQFRKRTQDQMARSRRGRGHERRPGLQPGSDAERQARPGARRPDGGPGSPHRPGQDRAADGGAGAAVPGHGHAGRAAGGGRHADRAEGRGGRRQPGQGQPGDWRGRRHGPQDAQEEVDLPGHLILTLTQCSSSSLSSSSCSSTSSSSAGPTITTAAATRTAASAASSRRWAPRWNPLSGLCPQSSLAKPTWAPNPARLTKKPRRRCPASCGSASTSPRYRNKLAETEVAGLCEGYIVRACELRREYADGDAHTRTTAG